MNKNQYCWEILSDNNLNNQKKILKSKIGKLYPKNYINSILLKTKYLETQNSADNTGTVISTQILKKALGKLKKILNYSKESNKIKALKNGLK